MPFSPVSKAAVDAALQKFPCDSSWLHGIGSGELNAEVERIADRIAIRSGNTLLELAIIKGRLTTLERAGRPLSALMSARNLAVELMQRYLMSEERKAGATAATDTLGSATFKASGLEGMMPNSFYCFDPTDPENPRTRKGPYATFEEAARHLGKGLVVMEADGRTKEPIAIHLRENGQKTLLRLEKGQTPSEAYAEHRHEMSKKPHMRQDMDLPGLHELDDALDPMASLRRGPQPR